jgi:predicted transcriptional regulator
MPKQRDSLEDQIARRVGQHLREIREYLGLGRKDIASELGVTERAVKSYEEGARRTTLADAVRLSRFLNVSLDRLVYGHSGPPQVLPRARFDEIGKPERTSAPPRLGKMGSKTGH